MTFDFVEIIFPILMNYFHLGRDQCSYFANTFQPDFTRDGANLSLLLKLFIISKPQNFF